MKKLILLAFAFTLYSCGPTSETVVVDRDAETVRAPEGTSPPGRTTQSNLRILRIGELDKIRSLDPLFLENNSSKRLAQLLYDGLVQFDENDEIVPAIARSWEVSEDSLVYTFRLNRNAQFQDSRVFTNGRGRRITARDFKFAYQRMAQQNKPEHGAGLFIYSVDGFESYFREQRELYFEEDRIISEVAGFKTPNDSTFVIELLQKDSELLSKLASPHAGIYPREAFRTDERRLHQNPVGSGPYKLRQSFGDSLYVLEKNVTHYGWNNSNSDESPDRIEVLIKSNETNLFRQLALGRLDVISELGPQMIQAMILPDGSLNDSYVDQYDVRFVEGGTQMAVYFNPLNRFDISEQQAASLFASISRESVESRLQLQFRAYELNQPGQNRISLERFSDLFPVGQQDRRLLLSFKPGTTERLVGVSLMQTLEDDYSVAVTPFRIQNRVSVFHLQREMSLVPENSLSPIRDYKPLLNISLDRYILNKTEIQNIQVNSAPWWMDVRNATVPVFNL